MKISLKEYREKPRIYQAVKSKPNVMRVLVWDAKNKEYLPPKKGKPFFARRYINEICGARVRETAYFDSIGDALRWQAEREGVQTQLQANTQTEVVGVLFRQVVENWKKRRYPGFAESTQHLYDQYLAHHFIKYMDVPIHCFSSRFIDEIIADWKSSIGLTPQSTMRVSFRHELDLLGTLLRYYTKYFEDEKFVFPIKDRHREDSVVRIDTVPKEKTLREFELKLFLREIRKGKHGDVLEPLAIVQYYNAGRISEPSALHWEDIRFDWREPSNSKIIFRRHMQWKKRRNDKPTHWKWGLKNKRGKDGSKEVSMHPEVFEVLKKMYSIGATGLVFKQNDGAFVEYKHIYNSYNRALKRAGLTYSGTHIMRHGWASELYDKTNGDQEVVKQVLGNTDLSTVLVS